MDTTKQKGSLGSVVTLLLVLIGLALGAWLPMAVAADVLWYDPSWSSRQLLTISNNTASELTEYQVQVNVAYDSDMQPDFDDIRFTEIDGATEINHWMESYTQATSAKFWVRVPSIPSGGTMIWMYFGNSAASSASDGKATFELFDDFNDGVIDPMWNVWTNASEANGLLRMVNTGEAGIWAYVNPTLSNFAVKVRIDISTDIWPAGSRFRVYSQNGNLFEYKYWWGTWGRVGFLLYYYP